MRAPYLTFLALVLFATIATETLGENDSPAETWNCFDGHLGMLQQATVIKLTREEIPRGQEYGLGEISASGLVHTAWFTINGLERRWDFGRDFHYAFVIYPSGDGLYYDFSQLDPGEPAAPAKLYKCELAPNP